jgi:hypothetical protein
VFAPGTTDVVVAMSDRIPSWLDVRVGWVGVASDRVCVGSRSLHAAAGCAVRGGLSVKSDWFNGAVNSDVRDGVYSFGPRGGAGDLGAGYVAGSSSVGNTASRRLSVSSIPVIPVAVDAGARYMANGPSVGKVGLRKLSAASSSVVPIGVDVGARYVANGSSVGYVENGSSVGYVANGSSVGITGSKRLSTASVPVTPVEVDAAGDTS